MINISELMSITLATEDLDASVKFYEDSWGLATQSRSGCHAYLRGTGPNPYLLELLRSDQTSLHKISFSLDSLTDVDEAADLLDKNNISLITQPTHLANRTEGYGLTFKDPDGNLIELVADFRQAVPLDQGHITQISHLALNTSNLDAMMPFYTDILGFQLSDWYENNCFVFLRCNSAHHRIVLAPAETSGINHIAFDVANTDAMMRTVGRMKKSGYTPVWGPGRHGPGGNTFCYFADPNGYVIEVSSDLIEITDDIAWNPQEWARTPENGDVWGTSGDPTKIAIDLMNGHRENFKLNEERTTE